MHISVYPRGGFGNAYVHQIHIDFYVKNESELKYDDDWGLAELSIFSCVVTISHLRSNLMASLPLNLSIYVCLHSAGESGESSLWKIDPELEPYNKLQTSSFLPNRKEQKSPPNLSRCLSPLQITERRNNVGKP
jgi:hypothetical protein